MQDTEEKQKVTVICTHCGYSWGTKSELESLSCPSCRLKFFRHGKIRYKKKNRPKFPALEVIPTVIPPGYNVEVR